MTPVEAIVKNMVAIGLLIWLFKIMPTDPKSNIWLLSTIKLACILIIFMLAPMKSIPASNDSIETLNTAIDSTQTVLDSAQTTMAVETTHKDTTKVQSKTLR